MAVRFTITKGTVPAPQVVATSTVIEKASSVGHPNAASAIGVTIPRITVDLSGVSFKQRIQAGVREFSFDTGTIACSLRQEVFLSNELSACEQRKWGAHEAGHVNDNRDAMDDIEAEAQTYGFFRDVFISGKWYEVSMFQIVQQNIIEEIGNVYRDLTSYAATSHDSIAEYRRVAREILRDCPGPIYYVVQRGDTLSHIALHYYGQSSKYTEIYAANRVVIGPNANLIRVGLRLVIPKLS